jgi:hypothetical protein
MFAIDNESKIVIANACPCCTICVETKENGISIQAKVVRHLKLGCWHQTSTFAAVASVTPPMFLGSEHATA